MDRPGPLPAPPGPVPLLSADAIATRVKALAQEIEATVPPGVLHAVVVLRGAFVFAADLLRAMDRDVRCDFLGVRSYGSATESSGVVQITQDLSTPISGRHVLLIEDIVDTGLTVRHLLDLLATRGPASLHVCTLLDKPERRQTRVPIDFVGFRVPNQFVVGYGLDHDQRFRNLPYVGTIEGAQP